MRRNGSDALPPHGHTALKNTENGVVAFEDAIWDAVYIGSPPAVVVSLVLMIVVSLATKKIDPPLLLTNVDGQPLPLKNRMGFMSPMAMFRDWVQPGIKGKKE